MAIDKEFAELEGQVAKTKAAFPKEKVVELGEVPVETLKQTLKKAMFAAELGEKKLEAAIEKAAEGKEVLHQLTLRSFLSSCL
jgi:DNA-binding ferritin-like protein